MNCFQHYHGMMASATSQGFSIEMLNMKCFQQKIKLAFFQVISILVCQKTLEQSLNSSFKLIFTQLKARNMQVDHNEVFEGIHNEGDTTQENFQKESKKENQSQNVSPILQPSQTQNKESSSDGTQENEVKKMIKSPQTTIKKQRRYRHSQQYENQNQKQEKGCSNAIIYGATCFVVFLLVLIPVIIVVSLSSQRKTENSLSSVHQNILMEEVERDDVFTINYTFEFEVNNGEEVKTQTYSQINIALKNGEQKVQFFGIIQKLPSDNLYQYQLRNGVNGSEAQNTTMDFLQKADNKEIPFYYFSISKANQFKYTFPSFLEEEKIHLLPFFGQIFAELIEDDKNKLEKEGEFLEECLKLKTIKAHKTGQFKGDEQIVKYLEEHFAQYQEEKQTTSIKGSKFQEYLAREGMCKN